MKATSSIVPVVPDPSVTKITLPAISSVAVGGSAGGGDAAVTGSVIVDVVSITTKALIADGTQVNQTRWRAASSQTLTVAAEDDTHLMNIAGALALTHRAARVSRSRSSST